MGFNKKKERKKQEGNPAIAKHTCRIFSIHSSVDGYLGYFHALAIVNNSTVNMRVQIFL